jgi:TRAP-type mannitol/chloroaromatic compound transport system permease small subunit
MLKAPSRRGSEMVQIMGLQERLPKSLLRLCRIVDAITDGAAFIAKWLVLVACLVCALNAISRYLFSLSSNGWLEIQWYMFAGIVLLGASQTLRLNGHVRVDLIYSRLSDRNRILIDIFGICFFLLPATTYFVWLTWPFFWSSLTTLERSSNAGGLLLWPAKGALATGFGLLLLQGVSELLRRLLALSGALVLKADYEAPLQ